MGSLLVANITFFKFQILFLLWDLSCQSRTASGCGKEARDLSPMSTVQYAFELRVEFCFLCLCCLLLWMQTTDRLATLRVAWALELAVKVSCLPRDGVTPRSGYSLHAEHHLCAQCGHTSTTAHLNIDWTANEEIDHNGRKLIFKATRALLAKGFPFISIRSPLSLPV